MSPNNEPTKQTGYEHPETATSASGAPSSSRTPGGSSSSRASAATRPSKESPYTAHTGGGVVAFVGAGPADESLLTVRGARLLAKADLIVALPDVATRLRDCLPVDAELMDACVLDGDTTPMVNAARAGKLVVRLVVGDPVLFRGGCEEAADCARAGVPIEIVPGVPCATAIPGYAGVPLTMPKIRDVRIVDASDADLHAVAAGEGTLVVLGAETGPAEIAKALVEGGRPDVTPIAVTWNGTTTEQETVVLTLGGLAGDLKAAGMNLLTTESTAIAVVGEVVAAREQLSWFETKPLFGWRVLVPRTKEQAGSLSERLRVHGAVPEEVPTISVEPPRTPQQMERAVKGLVTGRYQWIAFTSANAVRAVREKFDEYGLDARAFAGVKVAAVGEQTAAALVAFGIKPDLVPDGEQSGEGLAVVWPAYDELLDPINRVLLPRADIATETLVAKLTALGWEAEDVTAYRTVRAAPPPAPVREAIKGGGFDAVLFTSSSTVRNLVGIAGKPHAVTVIAAIGPQTAKTAQELGLRVDVMAPKPSVTELVEALAEYGGRQRAVAMAAGEPVRRPSQNRRGARRRARP